MISQRRHRYPKGDCRLPGPADVGAVALLEGAKVESSLPVLWQESCEGRAACLEGGQTSLEGEDRC